MKSTTCHKQTTTTSLTSATFATSDAASHHRHHPSQYRNNSITSSRGSTNRSGCSNIKMKSNDANNNDSNSMMATTTTTTSTATTKLPIISSTPTRSSSSSKNSEKYSLRQRQKRSFAMPSSSAAAMSIVSSELKTLDERTVKAASQRGNLNSTTKPRSNTSTSGSKEKSKTKAAPLSKYRRKTANARERTRMREINTAFENLRHCVPHTITGDQTASSNEKLTKITTLRLAMKYIRVLSEALENPSFQEDFLLECHNDGDHRFSTPNWVLPPICDVSVNSEEEAVPLAQPTPTTQARPKQRKTKIQTNSSKIPNKRQRTKTKIEETLNPQYSNSSSTFSSPFSSSSSSSAYASMSASPLFDDCHSMTDLSSMILESDGESLHLSEPCLSPLNRNYNLGLPSLDRITPMKTTPLTMDTENPLELSLRLLEPDTDSLEFSTDQQPSSCISPLATLDSFNPFGDLLHVEFPEHSSLDLFLT